MAYSFPATISTGDVLTASNWNQAIRENQKFGHATFTNEAARDTAITSPEEGMTAYLTAPTVPAAAGETTALPTGVQTVYNGSVWVCVTPVSSFTSSTGTTTSTSYTATLAGSPGTNPSVTLVTGTTALVTVSAQISNTGANNTLVSAAISGAGTVAANTNWAILSATASGGRFSATSIITGLTAGTNTFALNYLVDAGTGSYQRRNIVVQGIA